MKNTEIIKKNYEFKYFFKKGKFFSGKLIEIFIFYNNEEKNRLGIVVSKKVGGSVIRNRIKRYIRAAYTDVENIISNKCNLLIVWKKNIDTKKANYSDIKEDILVILKKYENNKG